MICGGLQIKLKSRVPTPEPEKKKVIVYGSDYFCAPCESPIKTLQELLEHRDRHVREQV
jgi:hypothetical protein